MRKVGVVLFNLGGPDSIAAIQPFLFNLFNDPAIIRAPGPIRLALAHVISRLRAPKVAPNYQLMGGRSPLVPETQKQADALVAALNERWAGDGMEAQAFLAMRYWRPFTKDALEAVRAWGANEIVLAPLYPQYSTTTTGSSLKAWGDAGGGPAKLICCYPSADGFIAAHAQAVIETWEKAGRPDPVRVLFSAHGLPQRVVDDGDPYQKQVEETVAAVSALLPPELQAQVCYQSRVGPLKWIGPSTEDALEEAAQDQVGVIVSPIAFVSEHIETLVELDDEYKERAEELGVPFYLRAPALGVRDGFISALADLVDQAVRTDDPVINAKAGGDCGGTCVACPRRRAA
jgi:protoporphyrin/coproporphyrin ferrochelatase